MSLEYIVVLEQNMLFRNYYPLSNIDLNRFAIHIDNAFFNIAPPFPHIEITL